MLCVVGSGAASDNVYINAEAAKKLSSTTVRGGPTATMTKPPEDASKTNTNPSQDNDNEYCMPLEFLLGDAERGQGVGEEQNHYKGPQTKTTSSAAAAQSSTSLSPQNSLDRVGYPSLDKVPTDLSDLSVEEVLQCLRWLNLSHHVDRFRAEQIDGELLVAVDQQVLIEEFGFKRFDAIKLEKFARHGWRPKLARASPTAHQHQYYNQQQQQQTLQLYSQDEPLYTDV